MSAPEMEAALRWVSTGSTVAWVSPTAASQPTLLLVATPKPWPFWLGLAAHDGNEIIPIALFKNAVPLFETTTAVVLQSELNARSWELAVNACLLRNPGLRGLFDRVEQLCSTGDLNDRRH